MFRRLGAIISNDGLTGHELTAFCEITQYQWANLSRHQNPEHNNNVLYKRNKIKKHWQKANPHESTFNPRNPEVYNMTFMNPKGLYIHQMQKATTESERNFSMDGNI